ncbi:hypothetical protein DdN1_06 [Dickeya phage BIM BV-99]
MHTNYQPARTGLTDAKIAADKHRRLVATYRNNPEIKAHVMAGLYSGRKLNPIALQLLDEGRYVFAAAGQHARLNYSDRGDFTNCYRGGF